MPFSKISHLSCIGKGADKQHYMHTVSGARLRIGEADYEKIHTVFLEQEGAKEQ